MGGVLPASQQSFGSSYRWNCIWVILGCSRVERGEEFQCWVRVVDERLFVSRPCTWAGLRCSGGT